MIACILSCALSWMMVWLNKIPHAWNIAMSSHMFHLGITWREG